MITFIKKECILISVKSNLSFFICCQYNLFYCLFFIKEETRLFRKDFKSYTLKLFIGIISINLYNFKTCYSPFTFTYSSVTLCIFNSLFLPVYIYSITNYL